MSDLQADKRLEGRESGRVALIAGAASGIGREIATRFARRGFITLLADKDQDAVGAVAVSLGDGVSQAMALDVTDPNAWTTTISEIRERHGRLDVLVNCAGVYLVAAAEATSFEAWGRVIDTNLSSVFYSLKFAAPLMANTGRATIINIASTSGLRGAESASADAASQAGVISLTRSAGQEFALHGMEIRVNAICPGPIETPILDGLEDSLVVASAGGVTGLRARLKQSVPLGRLGSPGDIADAALFLASEQAGFITATCLVVDGGQSA